MRCVLGHDPSFAHPTGATGRLGPGSSLAAGLRGAYAGRMSPPVVLLVGTTLPENLGAVARVMANFGAPELRLVAPAVDPADPRATSTAAAGAGLLASARTFAHLPEAIADLHEVWATSALEKELQKPVLGPRAAGVRLRASDRRVGLLMGPERTGLSYDDLTLATGLVCIPTHPEARALNLAQAVAILLWEWASDEEPPPRTVVPAPRQEQLALLDTLDERLRARGYFSEPKLRVRAWRNLRTALLRAGFSSPELRTLHGVLRMLAPTS